jgi:hypothetical protein
VDSSVSIRVLDNALDSACPVSWMEKESSWISAIKKTWNVNCKVYTISDKDCLSLERKFQIDTNSKLISGNNIPYIIEMSSNAIFTHEYGAFINWGYAKFLYKDRIYYVNVAPLVKLSNDLYDRNNLLCHMAKIFICIMNNIKEDRKNILFVLDGELQQI